MATPIPDLEAWPSVFERLPDPSILARAVFDEDGALVDLVIEHGNEAARRLSDRSAVGQRGRSLWPELAARGLHESVARVLATGRREQGDTWWPGPGALRERGLSWQLAKVCDDLVVFTFSEASERVWRVEQDRARFRAAFESSVAGMALLDTKGLVTRANQRLADLFDLPAAELTGRHLRELAGPGSADALQSAFDRCLHRLGESVEVETRIITPPSAQIWVQANLAAVQDPHGRPKSVILHLLDVSESKRNELELAYAATHDALTGLANRALAIDHLELALARCRAGTARPAVLFIDLDHFKVVNDSLGHSSGDKLLREVAGRLSEITAPGDTLARLGGDEFVMVCDLGPADPGTGAQAQCRRLLDALREPIAVEGHQVVVQASIGVTLATPESTAASLLRDADIAMYEAKRKGRASWATFSTDLHERALERLEAEGMLRTALSTNDIRSFFQPVVELDTRRTVGFEALARWTRDGSVIGPSSFLEMAEETGLIVPLTERVAWDAARGLATWRRARPASRSALWLSFNVSGRQLATPGFEAWLERLAAEAGLEPGAIVLELTERTLLQSNSLTRHTLSGLREVGYRVAIDDFGTGYSSLAYLRSLPVDIIKLDRMFVVDAPHDRRDRALLGAFVQVAEALELEVIAEGIETEEQAETVLKAGCRLAQGYQLARPSPDLGEA